MVKVSTQGRKTPNQRKKHVKQMTKEEISFVRKVALRALHEHKRKIIVSTHVIDKMIDDRADYNQKRVIIMLENLEKHLVEYSHIEKNNGINVFKRRILLRDNEVVTVDDEGETKQCNLCIVYDIDYCTVITSFYNPVEFTHEKLNWRRYSKSLKIISNTYKKGKRGSKRLNKKHF